MREKGPTIILLIGYLYVFKAIILIVPKFMQRFGIFPAPLSFTIISESMTRVLFAIILLTMAYGYLKLKIWGFWLMITYFVTSLIIFYFQLIIKHQITNENVIALVLFLIYTFQNRQYFGKKIHSNC